MQVKCYLATGPELNQTMMELLALTRNEGEESLTALHNTNAGISLSKNRQALILVGGRNSIHDFLMGQGAIPLILGTRPLRMSYARKHRIIGKNETCVKIVCGTGHYKPEDGSDYVDIPFKGNGMEFVLTPTELAHCLYFIYGWG